MYTIHIPHIQAKGLSLFRKDSKLYAKIQGAQTTASDHGLGCKAATHLDKKQVSSLFPSQIGW